MPRWGTGLTRRAGSFTDNGSSRGLRGGLFNNNDNNLHAASRNIDYPALGNHNIGFRVSEVPEPSSLALLALGGIVLARRRGLGR